MKRWGGQASCRPHPANTPSPYPPVPASPAPPLKCFTVEDPRDELQQETVRGGSYFPKNIPTPPRPPRMMSGLPSSLLTKK